MLVLTRRPGESVIIAGDIKITVVSVGPGRVKLGIEAPPHVRVDRQEIHDKIEQSADVLATVGSEVRSDLQSTMVNVAGPDTTAIMTGRSDQVSAPKPESEPVAAVPPLGRLNKYRAPRKPR